jgi:biofilm PGA synthesis N-glycosyltransferase PgaC
MVPAHNEGPTIASTITAIQTQTRKPDRIVVVADNCTDDTVDIARACGADVFETVDNTRKKAGALNQAVGKYLPDLGDHDIIAGFDADTTPEKHFLANAEKHHRQGRDAVGAIFSGRSGGGVIGQLQRSEYARFALDQKRRHDKVDVLSGTGWSYTARTLRDVVGARELGILPCDDEPTVWLTSATVEDFELTLALRKLGKSLISPPDCRVTTDIMLSLRDLWTQRLRWQRGTLDELRRYGWQYATWGLILKQMATYASIAITPVFLVYLAMEYRIAGLHGLNPTATPVWTAVGALLILDRIWRTRTAGKRALVLSAMILPEYLYDVARQFLYLRALIDHWRGSDEVWGAGHADI